MKRFLADRQAKSGQFSDTRTRILEAAARVFAENGYAEATLDQIAANAGMTKGAIYWHFSSKSDLYLSLCEQSLRHQLNSLPRQAKHAFGSSEPANALASLLCSQWECGEQKQERSMLFFEFVTSSREPAVRDKLRETFSKIFDEIGSIIQVLQEDGLLKKDVDPHTLAILFQALINGIQLMKIIDPERIRINALAREISRVLWDGLSGQ
jgi:AcrR family transcriptional regulator